MNLGMPALVVAALVAWTASPALAHAYLVETVPAQGATLAVAPAALRLTFDEPVTLVSSDAVRVHAATGAALACAGGAAIDPNDAATVVCRFDPPPRGGSYVVEWRVVSADSHVVAGSFGFGVRAAAGGEREQHSRYDPDAPFAVLLRWLQLLGIAALGGVAVFARAVVDAADAVARRRLRRIATAGGGVAAVAALASLAVQTLAASGGRFEAAPLGALLATPWGIGWSVRVAALGFALAAAGAGRSSAAIGGSALALLTLSASGHALDAPAPGVRALLVLADAAHASAAAVWLGGVAGFAALPRLAVPDRLARFTPLALAAVGVLVVGGLIGTVAHVPSPAALVASAYGRFIAIKVALLLPVVALGFVQLQTGRGARAGGTLAAARAETGLLILLFLLSATLAGTAPPLHARPPLP